MRNHKIDFAWSVLRHCSHCNHLKHEIVSLLVTPALVNLPARDAPLATPLLAARSTPAGHSKHRVPGTVLVCVRSDEQRNKNSMFARFAQVHLLRFTI